MITHDSKTKADWALVSGEKVSTWPNDSGALYDRFKVLFKPDQWNVPVRIQSGAGVQYGSVLIVIDAAVVNGFHHFSFERLAGAPDPEAFSALVKQSLADRRSYHPVVDIVHAPDVYMRAPGMTCLSLRPVTLDRLYREISRRVGRTSHRPPRSLPPVLFSADADVVFADVLTVLNIIRRAGATDVRFIEEGRFPNASHQQISSASRACI